MATRSDGKNKEGALEMLGVMLMIFVFVFWFVWFMASHKIVYNTTPLLRWLGSPWYIFNAERWTAINEAYVYFRNAPRTITFTNYSAYANACLLPLAYAIVATTIAHLVARFSLGSKTPTLKRNLKPMQVAKEISKVFPSIIPVLHLGPQIVADKLPLWRRQTFPEDVWEKEKIAGSPVYENGRLYTTRLETYFRGGEEIDGPHQKRNGRRWSKMLGFLVVDLLVDAKKQESICFPDRFSSAGKVIFGLLCAQAFGGREGKLDYKKACEQLNKSCAGQDNGLPNLTVAQWIYSKYRTSATAKKLFAVHHWEFTYLFALFEKAKKNGKATHTDFIWLKPLDRIMFYALNTVGRAAPPVEAAAVFVMHDYEQKCARFKRLPLRMRRDGTLESNIFVQTAVEGFLEEFNRYQAASDVDDDWWKKLGTWDAAAKFAQHSEGMRKELDEQQKAIILAASLPPGEETLFDKQMSERTQIQSTKEKAAVANAIGGAGGNDGIDLF